MLLGCDTTSRIHGTGKSIAFRKLEHFQDQARVFSGTAAAEDEVVAAGEKALVCLYNGGSGECLDSLRYTRFCKKVPKVNAYVQPLTP